MSGHGAVTAIVAAHFSAASYSAPPAELPLVALAQRVSSTRQRG